jgi:hypothetical protein
MVFLGVRATGLTEIRLALSWTEPLETDAHQFESKSRLHRVSYDPADRQVRKAIALQNSSIKVDTRNVRLTLSLQPYRGN